MYSLTLYSAVIVAGVVIGKQLDDTSAVLVKINPFISKSKKIIQLSGDGRYKRNGPEKSALYLEFPESFFEDPKLKRLYNSLIGGASGSQEKFETDKTDIVFKIDPSAFEAEDVKRNHKKRDVRGGEVAAFQLKIAPAVPHVKQMGRGVQGFVPRHQTTKSWCMEKMPPPEWNPDPVMSEEATESSSEVSETTCYPSKPSTPKLRICGGVTKDDMKARINDPCQCQSVTDGMKQVEVTPYDLYTLCKSRDPIVSHHVESLCFTTEKCSPKSTFLPYVEDMFGSTYKPIVKPSCPPSSTPRALSRRLFRKRRKEDEVKKFFKKRTNDDQVKNFFVLSNSPQSCPPFCPLKCSAKCTTTSTTPTCATTCPTTPSSTTCSTSSTCTTRTALWWNSLLTENPCSQSTSNNKDHLCPCSTTCPTTKHCCPIVKRLDDPSRNVLRLFRRRNPRRVRRNPTPFRRRRRIWVYKPKRGLRKVNFQSKKYA